MGQRRRIMASNPNAALPATSGRQDKAIETLMDNRDHPGFGFAMHHIVKLRKWGVEVGPELVEEMLNDGEGHIVREVENRQRANRGAPSLVYFIRFGNRIKIGVTTNLRSRLAAIPHDEVMATMPGSFEDEHALHKRFAHLRTGSGREWFRMSDDLMEFVRNLQDSGVSLDEPHNKGLD